MHDLLQLTATVTYWALILMWGFILAFYVRKMWGSVTKELFHTLMVILAIDAFRTLIESIYFGTWYTSLSGMLPSQIGEMLIRPEFVIIPKLINVVAAVLVIMLLLKRWIPQEELEKTQSREALKASEEQFRAFVSQSTDGISVSDLDGNYIYVNSAFCRMVGYSDAELLTMTVFGVTSDSQDRATFAKSKGSAEGTPIQVVLKRKDGSDFLAEVVGKNIEYGNARSVLGIVRDITDREKIAQERLSLERQVQHAQKLESLGVLAGGIAHDFNNLLTSILGNANLALDELSPMSPACESIREVENASKRAAALAKQMLAYSGKGQFVNQPIDIQALVEETANLIEVSVPKKVVLKYDFASGLPPFSGDVSQISQIIMNLITNAAEAISEKSGYINLATGVMDCSQSYLDNSNRAAPVRLDEAPQAGMYTYFEVSDTGCGMDSATIEKVFDPFFTTKFTGRGLGMSAVLGIVRGHGGALSVYSEVGRGTTFKILFPACDAAGLSPLKGALAADEDEAWAGSGTVLVADDEESVRAVGRRILERLGFQVLTAVDGREALKVFEDNSADIVCVLLDLTMPNLGGEETFSALRNLDSEVKVILCSGYNEQEATQHFVGKGLAGFLHKPYEMGVLKSTLRAVLSK